ncbi:alpha/beta-hydrolase [Lophiostoma macrostomum CBS 122681]|uniref:Alpha/beta-hydrolase n=1 Tax=Lophiostoma macrostomum CBS 122681 TaxID=1314788 RepID=A0A6A6TBJ3_9PLEO|nr:alpha/beta-hydrolase [Lophiostoma macrostomum CBS 122681]
MTLVPKPKQVESTFISTSSGTLELLSSLPHSPSQQSPLLCIHGAHCSANCYSALLPLFAAAGYPSYALSLRGHGKSWQPSTFTFHFLTGMDVYISDVHSALDHITSLHPDIPCILIGHSMGGGLLQRALTTWKRPRIAGLVLLTSAPLSGGGMDVARKWNGAEAALATAQPAAPRPRAWVPWLRSFFRFEFSTGVDTPAQVRNKFFSDEASDEVVAGWIRDSKSRLESLRVPVEMFWPIADAEKVLESIDGEIRPRGRKVLCVSAEKDALIPQELLKEDFDAYRRLAQGEEEVLQVQLSRSGHHVMLDVARERCVEVIVSWLRGMDV